MKKIFLTMIAFVMVFGLFEGCAAPAAQGTDGGAAVVNPTTQYDSVEELSTATGIEMQLPHSAELITVQSIDNTDSKLNEVTFKISDGTEFSYRKAKSDFTDTNGKGDISGNYAEWKDIHEATTPGGIKVTVKTGDPEKSDSGIAIWSDTTFKYVVSMDSQFDEGLLLAAVDGVR